MKRQQPVAADVRRRSAGPACSVRLLTSAATAPRNIRVSTTPLGLKEPRPKGLGELTPATLDAEPCDWSRFDNRKQVGSYTGCCPGEQPS